MPQPAQQHGGLWHGANWTFVIWGALHGCFLLVNHAWRGVFGDGPSGRLGKSLGWMSTFAAVTIAWVFFRAETVAGAWRLMRAMAGLDGVALPKRLATLAGPWEAKLAPLGLTFTGLETPWFSAGSLLTLTILMAIALRAPSAIELCAAFRPTVDPVMQGGRLRWQPNRLWALVTASAACAVLLNLTRVSQFIYFQF